MQNPVAYLALTIAMGGTAWAATKLPENSVGSAQIRSGAVTGAKVRASTLGLKTLSPALRRAVAGASIAYEPGGSIVNPCPYAGCPDLPAGQHYELSSRCTRGKAVSGAYRVEDSEAQRVVVSRSEPAQNGSDWSFVFTTISPGKVPFITATVICAT